MKTCLIALLVVGVAGAAMAAALSASRDTPERDGAYTSLNVASGSVVYAGSIVCVNSSGKAVPGLDQANYKAIGRAETTVNCVGSNYSSDKNVTIKLGTFRWANGTNTFTAANVGDIAYVQDDASVFSATCGTQDVAVGRILAVDSAGVWVNTLDK